MDEIAFASAGALAQKIRARAAALSCSITIWGAPSATIPG